MPSEHEREYHRKYRRDNIEADRQRKTNFRKKNPASVRASSCAFRDTRYFNLLPGEWEKMREFQREHEQFYLLLNKPHYRPIREAVEHRHSDGLIRGVMTSMLNRAYGIIERLYPDNTGDVLRALAEFHDNPPAVHVLGEPVYGLIGQAKIKKVMLYGPDGSPQPRPRRK